MVPTITNDESTRINVLKRYQLLDTATETCFDEITQLAAKLLDAPVALISLVDTDRVWFKSKFGTDLSEMDRRPGLCASAILSEGFYEIQDAAKHPETLDNPLVTGAFGLRFYAAYPLQTKKGYNLGTLCVMDKKARKLSETEKATLKSLRNLATEQIELRFSAQTVYQNHNRLLNIFAHDLKNPLATINMASEIIHKRKADPTTVLNMSQHISKSGKHALHIVEELLESAQTNSTEIQLQWSTFKIGKLLHEVVESNRVQARKKKQKIQIAVNTDSTIEADKGKVEEVFDNLINNAVKYSPEGKSIKVSLEKHASSYVLKVQDNGPGFTETEKKKLFKRFSKLSTQPTGDEISTGLGLFIVKNLVQAHNGNIRAESKGKNKGACFIVELPAEKKEEPPSPLNQEMETLRQ